jgi:hypothetical protein
MKKRFFLAATWTALLASAGCLRDVCERHGYYPQPPPPAVGYTPQCCVPCVCQPASGAYVGPQPQPSWNAPVAVSNTCPAGCVPAGR